MKKLFKLYILLIGSCAALLSSCERDSDFVQSTGSPYISNLDLRKLYKGEDLTLTKEVTREAIYVTGQVTSDHSGNNLPAGLLFIQNLRKVAAAVDSLRGIAINLGDEAAKYHPGDSLTIKIEGGVLKRVNGILQVTGVNAADVKKIATNVKLLETPLSAATLIARPENFEGCYGVLNNGNFEPNIGVEKIEGTKTVNDGSGDIQMNVSSTANFKSEFLPWSADVRGIVLLSPTTKRPQIWPRVKEDFVATSIIVDPNVPLGPHPAIITGYFANPESTDANYEYIQFMATQDLDFRQKPFSVYTTNNAGTPGFPLEGWNTGALRTYRFNIIRGTVAKGQFFYVGGFKQINGAGSTDISKAKWATSKFYNDVNGDRGIGLKTGNLLANSGNAAGIAIFPDTVINAYTRPCDVIFYGGNGQVYGNNIGYTITTNDQYNIGTEGSPQPFFMQGTNTFRLGAPRDSEFSYLGGVYDVSNKRWTTKRSHKTIAVPKNATISLIQEMPGVSKITN